MWSRKLEMSFSPSVPAELEQITLVSLLNQVTQSSLDKIQLIFPDSANFNIDNIVCLENTLEGVPSKFNAPDGPKCTVSKNLSSDLQNNILTITN